MRPILFGLIAVLLGCLGIEVPTDHTSTVSGRYGLAAIGFDAKAAPCYTSTLADPTLVPPDVNTAFLSLGTLTLDADGTGVFNALYEVRHERLSAGGGRGQRLCGHLRAQRNGSQDQLEGRPRKWADLPRGCCALDKATLVRRAVIPGHYAAIRFQPSVSGIRTANCVRPLVPSERAPSGLKHHKLVKHVLVFAASLSAAYPTTSRLPSSLHFCSQ